MVFSFTGGDPRQQMEIETVRRHFNEICTTHLGCVDCPLKTQDMQISNSIIRCNTGRGDFDKK